MNSTSTELLGKWLHVFPILNPRLSTPELIAEARSMFADVAPAGCTLTRCEWHRRGRELILLADLIESEQIRWQRRGLIWVAREGPAARRVERGAA